MLAPKFLGSRNSTAGCALARRKNAPEEFSGYARVRSKIWETPITILERFWGGFLVGSRMARQLGTGRVVRNFHGNPPVEVSFTRLGTTVAMCGEDASGPTISFANLLVEQYQGVSQERGAFSNTHAPQYPLNHTWLEDPH
eukprot:SAG25_NODE_155_length_13526_cov_48.309675_13_plen_141_part_00